MIKLYNSMSRKKEIFKPLTGNKINMYVCGMTVYDYCHIGHARVIVCFDMIRRYFMSSGYEVDFVRNITDIDDKIIARAVENNEDITALTKRFIDAMHEDEANLKAIRPTIEPRATEMVDEMIEMIEELFKKGHAYQVKSGDVLYSIDSFSKYGQLANQKMDELQAGQRVEVDTQKKNPLDFVLWKASKPGEPDWISPWGSGRPGWHIECSAMSKKTLGKVFDIHGGGLDLKFPHHECEIAQSEPVCGENHVRYWMHNGFVQVDNEKMSKSLGNFFTIRDVLEKYCGEVIRFFILTTHYRSPLSYSDSALDDAKQTLTRLYASLRDLDYQRIDTSELRSLYPCFFDAMDDDFNTSKAITQLFAVAKEIHITDDIAQKNRLASHLYSLGAILGILEQHPQDFLQSDERLSITPDEIEALIASRYEARNNKDFALADSIRDQLSAAGVEIEDCEKGRTVWRLK